MEPLSDEVNLISIFEKSREEYRKSKYPVNYSIISSSDTKESDNRQLQESVKKPIIESKEELTDLDNFMLKLHEKIVNERCKVIQLCLEEDREQSEQRQYARLIQEIGTLNPRPYFKYKKKVEPPNILIEHRCRAIARYLRRFNPNISIQQIYEHKLTLSFGFFNQKEKSFERFRKWLYKEEIYEKNANL